MKNTIGLIIWRLIYLIIILSPILIIVGLLSIRWSPSQEVVSGIAYNTSNDRFISGNTRFSIRASDDTYVSEENKSSFCLPPNSKYIELVNRAARNKEIKLEVTKDKYFGVHAPWVCVPNVTVTEQK